MATARDKLIAHWRHELHAAQDAVALSPEEAWLARMRWRLYRFLLACYAKSPWTTTPRSPDESQSVVFDPPEAKFLHGKPAKSAGKIQAVLKSVASAQGGAVAPGALQKGLAPESWVVVASATGHINTFKLARLLARNKLRVRRLVRGDDELVEVAAADFEQAGKLLHENHDRLHQRCSLAEVRRMECGSWIFSSLFGGVIVAAIAVIIAALANQGEQAEDGYTLGFLFFGCWGCVVVLVAILAMMRPVRAFFANFDERGCWIPEVRGFPRDDD